MADDNSTRIEMADILAIDDAIMRSTGAASYGITESGFVAKPFARILAEKLALARALFGNDIDLGSGSVIRKILEVSALEDARTWAALTSLYDNQFVATARGDALSRLGEELGLGRPYLEARGVIKLTAQLPSGVDQIALPAGARLLTAGLHHVALDQPVMLSRENPAREVPVVAFYPGPGHNLDPAQPGQRIQTWHTADAKLDSGALSLFVLARGQGVPPEQLVAIEHTTPLTGGETMWPDSRYRDLVLRAPRSIWSVDAIRIALSLVPGIRRVEVRDRAGGLDVDLPIFGSFNFLERLFGTERDFASPYYFDVMVAASEAAIWDGPDGLAAALATAMEDLRPIGIAARIEQAELVFVAISARLVVTGIPLPRSSQTGSVNQSPAAIALKERLLQRVRRYIDGLGFGEPVRFSEVTWAIMNEPGIADVQDLRLLRFPPSFGQGATQAPGLDDFYRGDPGENVAVRATQIAAFVDTDAELRIV